MDRLISFPAGEWPEFKTGDNLEKAMGSLRSLRGCYNSMEDPGMYRVYAQQVLNAFNGLDYFKDSIETLNQIVSSRRLDKNTKDSVNKILEKVEKYRAK